MNLEDFTKSKKELEEQQTRNYEKYHLSDERKRMVEVNSFEYKAGVTFIFAMISFILLYVISSIAINVLGVTAFTSILPGFSYPILLFGGSLGLGTIGRILMFKKYKAKERFKEFSTAKTQIEKLEEEIKYQIELEKMNNRNYALFQALKNLNSNQYILKAISNKYDIREKNTQQSEADVKQKIEELTKFLKENYDELDLASTKKVLHDRFWRIRSKSQKIMDTILASMLSGVVILLFSLFPTLLTTNTVGLAILYIPAIIGVVVAGGYMVKRNSIYQKVFNKFNSKLGDKAFDDKANDNEQQDIKTLIEDKTRDISLAEIQLKEQQRTLEKITEKDKDLDSDKTRLPEPEPILGTSEKVEDGLKLVRKKRNQNE